MVDDRLLLKTRKLKRAGATDAEVEGTLAAQGFKPSDVKECLGFSEFKRAPAAAEDKLFDAPVEKRKRKE